MRLVDDIFPLGTVEKAGAILTTVETTVFEWCVGSAHPQFKSISKLVQNRMASVP